MLGAYTFLVFGSTAQLKVWRPKIESQEGKWHSRVKREDLWPSFITHIILPAELMSATPLSKTLLSSKLLVDLGKVESLLKSEVCILSSQWIIDLIKYQKEHSDRMLPFHDRYLFKVEQQLSINEWIESPASKLARPNPEGKEGIRSIAMKDGDTKTSGSESWWNVSMLPGHNLKCAMLLRRAVEDDSLDLRWDWIDLDEITLRIDQRQREAKGAFQYMSFVSLSALEYICADGEEGSALAATSRVQVKAKLLEYNQSSHYLCVVCNVENDIQSFQQHIDKLLNIMPEVAIDIIGCNQQKSSFFRLPICGMFSFMRHARAPQAQTLGSNMIVGLGDEFSPYYKYALNLGIRYQPLDGLVSGNGSSDNAMIVTLTPPLPSIPDPTSKPSYYSESTSNEALDIAALATTCCPPIEYPESVGGGAVVHREVVLLVGPSASGKSTLAKALLKHTNGLRFSGSTSNGATSNNGIAIDKGEYAYINQDQLGSREKCIETSQLALLNAQNVLVDNTNVDKTVRRQWIDWVTECNKKSWTVTLYAKSNASDITTHVAMTATLKVHIRCICWLTSISACLSMLHYRLAGTYTSNEEPGLYARLVKDVSVIEGQRRQFEENEGMEGELYERVDKIDRLVLQEPNGDVSRVLFRSYMY
jgi:energy-coupling factor transporter ATP-binding protein EcfA2